MAEPDLVGRHNFVGLCVRGGSYYPGPPMLFGLKAVSEMPLVLVSELVLLNGIVSVLCAYYFRKFGFLAAVGIHFWTDVIWHVVWGLV